MMKQAKMRMTTPAQARLDTGLGCGNGEGVNQSLLLKALQLADRCKERQAIRFLTGHRGPNTTRVEKCAYYKQDSH